jgi:hypothetical protein
MNSTSQCDAEPEIVDFLRFVAGLESFGHNFGRFGQEESVLLFGGHISPHDFLEPQQNLFGGKGFFVVE